MNAILTEFPDLPDTWQVYGGTELPATLEHLGLVQPASQSTRGRLKIIESMTGKNRYGRP